MNATEILVPITLTVSAIEEIKHLQTLESNAQKGLRIGVEGGGCAGFSYLLQFDEKNDADNLYIIDGIEIYINKTQEMYLFGTNIDFKKGLENRGFIYENPNAKHTCGCGTSFSA